MRLAEAQTIVNEASRHRHILAEIDMKWARGITRDTGYRVKLTLKPEHRMLTIKDEQDWPAIRDTWIELLAA